MKAFEEYLNFLTSSPTLEAIIEFSPTEKTVVRAQYLAGKQRVGKLNDEERAELNEYRKAEMFVDHMKARAQRRLSTV